LVIQRLSEGRLFLADTTKWVGSAVLGGMGGVVIGALLARLEAVEPSWALGIGGPAGALAAIAVLAVHRSTRSQDPL
jgi:hypothetical protein